jgi:two-component sensor histidine kinase
LALIVHELATNSLKYGALSVPTGTLDVSCSPADAEVVIAWTERGGPVVEAPTKQAGYGSRLVARTVSRHLGGSIAYDWSSEGLIVTLRLDKARLAT